MSSDSKDDKCDYADCDGKAQYDMGVRVEWGGGHIATTLLGRYCQEHINELIPFLHAAHLSSIIRKSNG